MKTIFVLNSDNFEKIYYAFCMATTAAALNKKVVIFFAGKAIKYIAKKIKFRDQSYRNDDHDNTILDNKFNSNLVSFEELITSSIELKINFSYCSMIDELISEPIEFLKGIKVKSENLTYIFTEKNNQKNTIIFI